MDLQNHLLKYKLKELLENLTIKQYERAMAELPDLLGKCKNTIMGYANIPLSAKKEMPYVAGWIIEEYFGLPPRGLYNLKINCKRLDDGRNAPESDQSVN